MQIFTKLGFKPAVVRFRKVKWGNETVIRTAYPVPQVKQLRLRLELATRRTRRAFTERHRSLRGDAPAPPYAEGMQARYDRLAAYNDFEVRFDAFVSLLCVAAQEGATAEREAAFTRQRAWFVAQYPVIRPYLKAFLSSGSGNRTPSWWTQRPCDVFEALFRPLELTALLKDGDVIPRLERAQDVVAAWYKSFSHA